MHPTLFTIHLASSSIPVKAYPFFMLLAAIVMIVGTVVLATREHLSIRPVVGILSGMLIASFVGSRLFHGLLNLKFYADHPERWLAFDLQGFAIFGGVLGAGTVWWVGCRVFRFNFWKLSDRLVFFLGISIALIRVGCFLNGCCFGKVSHLPWSVTFPLFSPAHKYQLMHHEASLLSVVPVHPTELYELAAALLGSLIAWHCVKEKKPAGTAALIFGIWFASFRLGNYFLRVPAESFDAPIFFYPCFYCGLIFLGIILFLHVIQPRVYPKVFLTLFRRIAQHSTWIH
jgi:phosphatidylglycerol:prolipoprotein diacylglycerol transferase